MNSVLKNKYYNINKESEKYFWNCKKKIKKKKKKKKKIFLKLIKKKKKNK